MHYHVEVLQASHIRQRGLPWLWRVCGGQEPSCSQLLHQFSYLFIYLLIYLFIDLLICFIR